MEGIRDRPCRRFTPFPGAPEVCDDCGNEAGRHAHGGLPPDVGEAMWRLLFKHGGTPSGFGGIERYRMPEIIEHVTACGINWDLTEAPHLQSYTYTADSYADSESTEILAGTLWCKCSKISYEMIAIEHCTLGQLMWMAAHIDDQPEGGTR